MKKIHFEFSIISCSSKPRIEKKKSLHDVLDSFGATPFPKKKINGRILQNLGQLAWKDMRTDLHSVGPCIRKET
jgi:hypothetical protein